RQSRYAFRRHFYQHAGFRYIQSEAPIQTHDVFYETDPEVCIAADSDWSRDRKLENELSGRLLLALASVMEPGKKG
ncbi:MAG TPA: SAM-dependent methyltransferase, partial [Candidatus Cloacimonadota bacterium]|nr:SAM-dependent methyltransferase [Candidatus Cloacimonadota bacterium]